VCVLSARTWKDRCIVALLVTLATIDKEKERHIHACMHAYVCVLSASTWKERCTVALLVTLATIPSDKLKDASPASDTLPPFFVAEPAAAYTQKQQLIRGGGG